jgi:8-oxo-dGTP diphosphatase
MIQVAKAIIKKDDKFILLRRANSAKFWPGLWDFPGGKINPGEEAMAGAMREASEETGLEILVDGLIAKFDLQDIKDLIHFKVYSVKNFSGEVKISVDHTEFKWLSKEEITTYDLTPGTKIILAQLK